MAQFLLNNLFRIAVSTLNFVSPSILADVLLHPFDFATVLLQIGYDPEGIKYEAATLVSVIVQYALFTFYIPYLLTSMQGLQFMGIPHPSIFYYVNYIYKKEGLIGCYRGLMPKIFERMIMVTVNERVKRKINKDMNRASSNSIGNESDQDKFIQSLINSVCSQFFAVLASHPFHVLMVSSFAEFTYNKKSSILELSQSIYLDDGCFGFFTGLTARLLGETLSMIFSLAYTTIINKQLRPQEPSADSMQVPTAQKTSIPLVDYVTDASRFTALKQPKSMIDENMENSSEVEEAGLATRTSQSRIAQYYYLAHNFLGNITHNSFRSPASLSRPRNRRASFLAYIPLTSKLFYYVMIRDFLSRKISNPFFLVCHCAIVLDTGWDKFPLISYLVQLVDFVQMHLKPVRKNRLRKRKIVLLNNFSTVSFY